MITGGTNVIDAINRAIDRTKESLDIGDGKLIENIEAAIKKLNCNKSMETVIEGSYVENSLRTRELLELKATLEVVKDVLAPLAIRQELDRLQAIKIMLANSSSIEPLQSDLDLTNGEVQG